MIVGIITVKLKIPMAQSLKDKRRVIKSLTDKSKNKFNIAVAEVGNKDLWKDAELGLVTIADDKRYLEKVINNIIKYVEDFPEALLYKYTVDYY